MFSVYYIKSKRAVSPVISSMLLIALIVAAGVSIMVVLDNANTVPTVETNDDALNIFGGLPSDELNISISLLKSSIDLSIYQSENKKYYTSLSVTIDYYGMNSDPVFIYIADIDVFVYGEKLDEISPWIIDSTAITGAEIQFDNNGDIAGYRQTINSTATYIVNLSDKDIKNARIFYETSFSYRAKIGTEIDATSGRFAITQSVENEEISKIVFNTIYKTVSIFHYAQSLIDTTSALYQWVDILNTYNGSNKIYFLFDSSDIYDISQNEQNTRIANVTEFANSTDLVIFAEWAIHTSASAFVQTIFDLNVPMTFGGSVRNIWDSIDATLTEQIIGVIPNVVQHNFNPRWSTITNSYQFYSVQSNLLVDIAGTGEASYVEENGFDAAYINSSIATKLGESNILIRLKLFGTIDFNHTDGVLLSLREANATYNTPLITSLVINHEAAALSRTAFRNMLFYAFSDPERIIISNARLEITSFTMTDTISNGWFGLQFREDPAFAISAIVTGGNIDGGSVNLTLNMDSDIRWTTTNGYTAQVIIAGNIYAIPFNIIQTSNAWVINLAIGDYHNMVINEGDTISIAIPESGALNSRGSFSFASIWEAYSWNVAIEYRTSDGAIGAPATAATSPP